MVKALRLLSRGGQVHAWKGPLACFLLICEGTVSGGRQTEVPGRQKDGKTNPPGRELTLGSAQDGSWLAEARACKSSAGGEESSVSRLARLNLSPVPAAVCVAVTQERQGQPLCWAWAHRPTTEAGSIFCD